MKRFITLMMVFSGFQTAQADVKEWTIEVSGAKSFAQYSSFKSKLKSYIADNIQCVERRMNRSQIIIGLVGKPNVIELKGALNQMTQADSDVKIDWKMKEVDDKPYFIVELQ